MHLSYLSLLSFSSLPCKYHSLLIGETSDEDKAGMSDGRTPLGVLSSLPGLPLELPQQLSLELS